MRRLLPMLLAISVLAAVGFAALSRGGQRASATGGAWTNAADAPNFDIDGSRAVTLADGRVLVSGIAYANPYVAGSAVLQLYSPDTDAWSAASGMPADMFQVDTLTQLLDGRVLVVGHNEQNTQSVAAAFDPATDAVTPLMAPEYAHREGVASLMPGGGVLIVGGYASNDIVPAYRAEWFDPYTNTWSLRASLPYQLYRQPAVVADGRFTTAGLLAVDASPEPALRYDAGLDTWAATGTWNQHEYGTATLLPDGRAFFVGGYEHASPSPEFRAPQLFDPITVTWADAAMPITNRYSHGAALLLNGTVLVAGGYSVATNNLTPNAEAYDPTSGAWSAVAPMLQPSFRPAMARLNDGRVLAVGNNGKAQIFDPGIPFSSPTPTPSSNPATATNTPTQTATPTVTPTMTPCPGGSCPPPTDTPTNTLTPTPTFTPPPTSTFSPTPTITPTPTNTPCSGACPTATDTPTNTPTPTPTATPTPCAGPCPSTPTSSPTGTPTTTSSPTPSATPCPPPFPPGACVEATNTPLPTATATPCSATNNDADFISLAPWGKPFDDLTRARSDTLGDACDSDDDNDGLSDATESGGPPCASASGATDPLKEDTDGDRVLDGAECAFGSDPANAASRPAPPAAGTDQDLDGLSNAVETSLGTNPTNPDTDGDGVLDGVEVMAYNTDPTVEDSDGDGCKDGKEIASINGDRTVNAIDLQQVAQAFGMAPAANYVPDFDQNKDGRITAIDLQGVAKQFGPC